MNHARLAFVHANGLVSTKAHACYPAPLRATDCLAMSDVPNSFRVVINVPASVVKLALKSIVRLVACIQMTSPT